MTEVMVCHFWDQIVKSCGFHLESFSLGKASCHVISHPMEKQETEASCHLSWIWKLIAKTLTVFSWKILSLSSLPLETLWYSSLQLLSFGIICYTAVNNTGIISEPIPWHIIMTSLLYFYFIFSIFRERGREGEREGEKHWHERETWIGFLSYAPWPETGPATQACTLTENQIGNILVYRTMPNQLNYTDQSFPALFFFLTTDYYPTYNMFYLFILCLSLSSVRM